MHQSAVTAPDRSSSPGDSQQLASADSKLAAGKGPLTSSEEGEEERILAELASTRWVAAASNTTSHLHCAQACASSCSQEQAPVNVPALDQDLEAQLQQAMSLKSRPHLLGRDRRHRSTSLASVVPPRLVSVVAPVSACAQLEADLYACMSACLHSALTHTPGPYDCCAGCHNDRHSRRARSAR